MANILKVEPLTTDQERAGKDWHQHQSTSWWQSHKSVCGSSHFLKWLEEEGWKSHQNHIMGFEFRLCYIVDGQHHTSY